MKRLLIGVFIGVFIECAVYAQTAEEQIQAQQIKITTLEQKVKNVEQQ